MKKLMIEHDQRKAGNHSAWAVIIPGIITLVLVTLIISKFLQSYQHDYSVFISVGSDFADPAKLLPNISISADPPGYDGQFYYRLALDPFTNKRCDDGICFDIARYRHQRILYPILVKLATWGNKNLVPYGMIYVNLFLLSFIGILGGFYARSQGKKPIYGLAFSIYFGLILSLLRDLTEITEVFFILAAVVSMPKSRQAAAVLLALAVLARETAILLAVVVLAVACWQRWKDWYWFTLPVLTFAGWQFWLFSNWGSDAFTFFPRPFIAITQLLVKSFEYRVVENIVLISAGAGLSLVILVMLLRFKAPAFLKISWLLYTVLLTSLGQDVWEQPMAYVRVSSDWYTLGMLLLLSPVSTEWVTVRSLLISWFHTHNSIPRPR